MQKKKIFLTIIFWAASTILPLAYATDNNQAVDILKNELEVQFARINENFDKIVGSKEIRSSKLKSVDLYFINQLKKYQVFHSFIRTNSKGTVISEVIRGQQPKRSFRKINRQRPFTIPATNKKLYSKLIQAKKTGRYHLIWSAPVLASQSYGKAKFSGVVVVKIDIWDVCHEFSKTVDMPFRILLGRKTLYNHKWEGIENPLSKRLNVPGAEKCFIQTERTIVSTPTLPEKTTELAAADKEKPKSLEKPSQPAQEPTKIIAPTKQAKPPTTPLEKRVKRFSSFHFGVAAVLIVALVVGFMLLRQSKREKESIL